jgi:hypothetical protein
LPYFFLFFITVLKCKEDADCPKSENLDYGHKCVDGECEWTLIRLWFNEYETQWSIDTLYLLSKEMCNNSCDRNIPWGGVSFSYRHRIFFSFPNFMKVVVTNFYYKIMVIKKAIKSIIWIALFSLNFGGITMTYHSLIISNPTTYM